MCGIIGVTGADDPLRDRCSTGLTPPRVPGLRLRRRRPRGRGRFQRRGGPEPVRAAGPPCGRESISALERVAPTAPSGAQRHRPHPLGDPRCPDRGERPPPPRLQRASRRRAQRHHREPPRARRQARRRGPRPHLANRHGGGRSPRRGGDRRRCRLLEAVRRCVRCCGATTPSPSPRPTSRRCSSPPAAPRRSSSAAPSGSASSPPTSPPCSDTTRRAVCPRGRRGGRSPAGRDHGSSTPPEQPVAAGASCTSPGVCVRPSGRASRTSCRRRSTSSPAPSPTRCSAASCRKARRSSRSSSSASASCRRSPGSIVDRLRLQLPRRLARRGAPSSRWAKLPCTAEIASEFRYRDPVIDTTTLVLAISQSGETVDTFHALREAKRRGARTMVVTNVVDSLMAREADGVLYTHAGPEIGVASTKCHLAQIMLAAGLRPPPGRAREHLGREVAAVIGARLGELPGLVCRGVGELRRVRGRREQLAGRQRRLLPRARASATR